MAVLQDPGGKRITLAARTLVGRSRSCLVRIDSPRVSGEHASITWTRDRWLVRDLGSSNGTLVGTQRLSSTQRSQLRVGTALTFADTELQVASVASPANRAVRIEDGHVVEDDGEGLLILAEKPSTVAIVPRGDDWVLDAMPDALRVVHDQEEVEVAGARWQLELPPEPDSVDTTERVGSIWLQDTTMTFRVSRDREHVSVSLEAPTLRRVELPSRVYQQVLLALARAKLSDAASGISPDECGWVYTDDLQNEVDMDRIRLNMALYRGRKAIQRFGALRAQDIVERRLDTQQIRIGVARVAVEEA